jgi:hypothetical protein
VILQVHNLSTKELWKPTLDEDNSGSSKSSKHNLLLLRTYMLAICAVVHSTFKEPKTLNVNLVVV